MYGGENIEKKVKVLSGGERSRLAMIRLLLEPVNLLILDEPTNHLDISSKQVLKDAIKAFDGTAIIISHDRDFLDGLVSKVYEFGNQRVREHLCGIYEYLEKKNLDSLQELEKKDKTADKASDKTAAEQPAKPQTSDTLSFEEQKDLKRKRSQLEKTVKATEKQISDLEQEISELETKMTTPEGSSDQNLYIRHGQLRQELEAATEKWMEASEELENLK